METETTTEFRNGEKAIIEQILASEERNRSKQAQLWVVKLGKLTIQVGKLTIWVRSFAIEEIMTEFTRSVSSTRIASPYDGH